MRLSQESYSRFSLRRELAGLRVKVGGQSVGCGGSAGRDRGLVSRLYRL